MKNFVRLIVDCKFYKDGSLNFYWVKLAFYQILVLHPIGSTKIQICHDIGRFFWVWRLGR